MLCQKKDYLGQCKQTTSPRVISVCCSAVNVTIRLSYKTRVSYTDCSLRNGMYGATCFNRCVALVGHPSMTTALAAVLHDPLGACTR